MLRLLLPVIYICAGISLILLSACTESSSEDFPTYSNYHTITLSFQGPETSETAADNPFLNYRLTVSFTHPDTQYIIRGFFAADGQAAETGADAGNVWKVRFTPDRPGSWNYVATLHQEPNIALNPHLNSGNEIALSDASGKFIVVSPDQVEVDLNAQGRLINDGGFYRFSGSGAYWIKGGANSPENLLAYEDFDGTYRMQASDREGEASTNEQIHTFEPHIKDWMEGDLKWQNGKGKGIIGAMNYLAGKGMNSVYFLVMNIGGDGKDVWPYVAPDQMTRFDVSKLEQWEILFQHMQSKGIMLHIVLQETENEKLLDDGDTGPMRKLLLLELIARFGHHLALTWNLGEENGPADFSPNGQNDRQRKDMISYIKESDPYRHPVLLHTHASDPARKKILDSIVGFEPLDGLSLQVHDRTEAGEVVAYWKAASHEHAHPWLITMDEIGMWHTGAKSDSVDPFHETLRSDVLWGALLSGAAGVEWYFGARSAQNDLTTEDWRTRDQLWELTHHAMYFLDRYVPFWEMEPAHELMNVKGTYCLAKKGEIYVVYLPNDKDVHTINLNEEEGAFKVEWFNPILGGELMTNGEKQISGGRIGTLTPPLLDSNISTNQDWIAFIRKIE